MSPESKLRQRIRSHQSVQVLTRMVSRGCVSKAAFVGFSSAAPACIREPIPALSVAIASHDRHNRSGNCRVEAAGIESVQGFKRLPVQTPEVTSRSEVRIA